MDKNEVAVVSSGQWGALKYHYLILRFTNLLGRAV